MLGAIAENDRFKRSNLNLFEIGVVFDGVEPGQQHNELIIARTGGVPPLSSSGAVPVGNFGANLGIKHGVPATIYSVREDLLALFPGAVVENDPSPEKWAHPFRAGRLLVDGKVVAVFAELSPFVAKKFGIKTNVEIGIVHNGDALPGGASFDETRRPAKPDNKYSLAEFPMITRDFAFITDAAADALMAAARGADARICETNIFDVFAMPDGARSVALEIVIQPDSNLSDADLLAIQNKVIVAAEALGAKLRDK
jgi:phenylalanyl-tRNA synthetase beta subunit